MWIWMANSKRKKKMKWTNVNANNKRCIKFAFAPNALEIIQQTNIITRDRKNERETSSNGEHVKFRVSIKFTKVAVMCALVVYRLVFIHVHILAKTKALHSAMSERTNRMKKTIRKIQKWINTYTRTHTHTLQLVKIENFNDIKNHIYNIENTDFGRQFCCCFHFHHMMHKYISTLSGR